MRKCLVRIKGNNIKFDRDIEKSIIIDQNEASLHTTPPNDFIHQTWSFDGAVSELAPF